MQPTIEILEKLNANSKNNHNEVFTRIFRYLLRSDIYYIAYKKLQANDGAATKGIDDDTADGFSENYVNSIIERLKNESYRPRPVRRIYMKKQNGKMRPLGIPTFTDKLVQEVMRMILEAIYEPVFLDFSHGFRPKRSCHTALKAIKKEFTGTTWFIEGDICGCFDNIHHGMLIKCVERKIKDARFTKLLYAFLKAGYLEDWHYHDTYSGTPQGGIISPILANIYLHELDNYINQMKKDFDYRPKSLISPAYKAIQNEMYRLQYHIKRKEGSEQQMYIEQWKAQRKLLVQTPCKLKSDKKIKYIRYADDFLIGVNGSGEECVHIKEQIASFLKDELKMDLSEEKTLITHSSNPARFLGYDVSVRRTSQLKPGGPRRTPMRTLNNTVDLAIPFKDKIEKFLFSHGIVEQDKSGVMEPVRRPGLLRLTDMEIVSTYNSELRGLCNYYNLASNFYKLNYFGYLMEHSCLKTLAGKHKSKISKIKRTFKDGQGRWGVPYETSRGKKRLYFSKYSDCTSTECKDAIPNTARVHAQNINAFDKRLKAHKCELCGTTEAEKYEIHHVNKLKNLKGKEHWEIVMIAKQRKTLAVCHECHVKIHHGFSRKKH